MISIVFKRANVFECSHALHVHKTSEQSIFVNLCMYIFSKYITDIDTCSLLTVSSTYRVSNRGAGQIADFGETIRK